MLTQQDLRDATRRARSQVLRRPHPAVHLVFQFVNMRICHRSSSSQRAIGLSVLSRHEILSCPTPFARARPLVEVLFRAGLYLQWTM